MDLQSLLSPASTLAVHFLDMDVRSRVNINTPEFSESEGFVCVTLTIVNNSDDLITIAKVESAIEGNWYDTILAEVWGGSEKECYIPPPRQISLEKFSPRFVKPKEFEIIELKTDNKSVMSADFTLTRKNIWKGTSECYLKIK